ncbi:MAG TPA: hypothetical protein VGO33_12890 [Gemmatimonadaceae bacterium]|jgi:hypothetical protein|nr:hypothetical protein [Gemmatimonadaceae bacterium]
MSNRLTTAKAKRRQQRNQALLRIGVIVALVAVVGVFYFRAVIAHPQLDPVTLCPARVQGVTVLLVDVTDSMNIPQRQDFVNQIEALTGKIPRYGKLVVTKVDPVSNQLLKPIITRCNPGSGSDVSAGDDNPQLVEQVRQEKFLAPLRQAFNAVLGASGADRSPILESVQSVALTELQRPELATASKRLVIASDLLQNTTRIRFYTRLPDAAQFIASQEFSRVRTDLRGVSVELWMLQRNDSRMTQPLALPELWKRIIEEQGGTLQRVYVVSG